MWVLFGSFFFFLFSPNCRLYLHNLTRIVLANLRWKMCKKPDLKLDLAWFRATSHTRLGARDHYISSTLIGGKGGVGSSSLHTTLGGPTEYCIWMQDGCEVYMDSYVASNGSCFIITWIGYKNHLLEVGLTQNRETIMALQTPTTVDSFYAMLSYHVWGPALMEIHWNNIWLGGLVTYYYT